MKLKKITNIISIALNNLKKENRSSSLGYAWLILNPIVEATTYALVFGIFFPGDVDGIAKFPWIITGVFTWSFLAKGFLSGIDSFYSNSHLVKKIKFPLENIPQITVVQEYFRYLLLIILIFIVLAIYHIYPSLTWFLIIYSSLATILFLNAATKFVSVLSTLVKDIQNIVSAVFNVVFWISGVVFDVETIKNTHKTIYSIIKVNPFEYLISTWRKVFLNKFVVDSNFIKYSIIFWTTTFVVYLLGKITMNKFKGDFADII